MRVFIAINFTPQVKAKVSRTIQELKREAIRGNFTRVENLHLTLAFLGEVPPKQIQEINKAMSQAMRGRTSFDIEIGGLGKFINRGECLYWCGIEKNEQLEALQQSLVTELQKHGFKVDNKPFQPHITLGRRCKMNKNFIEQEFAAKISQISMNVTRIHLMLSEYKDGRLTYSSLREVELREI